MSTVDSDKKFLIGLLLGLGVGFAATALVVAARGGPSGSRLRERALDLADRVSALGRGPSAGRDRRIERAGRGLMSRVERMRSAGL